MRGPSLRREARATPADTEGLSSGGLSSGGLSSGGLSSGADLPWPDGLVDEPPLVGAGGWPWSGVAPADPEPAVALETPGSAGAAWGAPHPLAARGPAGPVARAAARRALAAFDPGRRGLKVLGAVALVVVLVVAGIVWF